MGSTKSGPRVLSVEEKQELLCDMTESSAWARAELKRRREEKAKQNAEHGINNGTTTESSPKIAVVIGLAALVDYRVGMIQLGNI